MMRLTTVRSLRGCICIHLFVSLEAHFRVVCLATYTKLRFCFTTSLVVFKPMALDALSHMF